MYAGHLDLNVPLLWTVDGCLPSAECDRYIAKIRSGDAEIAPIVGKHGVEIDLATRNNTRVMWDDEAEANALLDRVRASVPTRLLERSLRGANPRLRLYRYGLSEMHGAHWDTVVEFEDGAQSLLTLVFYLNDDFQGGSTNFPELGQNIIPRRGSALLFQHRVLHEASRVERGEKFVLRTDVVYK